MFAPTDVAELAPNAPYDNWSQTNRSNMFTPIDAEKFYFPGPIQKALNYGWDRYLNVAPLVQFLAQLTPDDNRPALYQSFGAKNRHPLVVTHPRFDVDPLTGRPGTFPAPRRRTSTRTTRRSRSTRTRPTTRTP